MALESVFAKAPPKVGHANKDTQNGEIESSIDDGPDLEEGEIVDSGKEDSDDHSKTDGKLAGEDCGARKAKRLRTDKKKRKKGGEEQRTKEEEEEGWFSPTSSPRHRPSHHHGHHDYPVGPFEDSFMRSDSPDGGSQPGEVPFHAGRRKAHPLDKRAALKKKKKKLKPGPRRARGEGRSICKFYLDSKCLKGADCPFSHDAPVPRKQDLCKFYLSGYCARGENCSFMHEDFPCKFFHTGAKCFADTHCRFSHAPLDDEKQLLLQRYLDSHGSRMDDEGMRHWSGGDCSPMRGDCGGPHDEDQGPAKRPSLLGSPPRHIKEAAESWRMQFLGGPGGPIGHMMSPPRGTPFVRPNSFYMDTLSPIRGGLIVPPQGMDEDFPRIMGGTPFRSPSISSPPLHDQGQDEGDKDNMDSLPRQPITIIPNATCDSQSSTIQSASNIPGLTLLLPGEGPTAQYSSGVSDPDSSHADGFTKEQRKDDEMSQQSETSSAETTAEAAILPPNLPRRQRELFIRIQQQQKEQREAEECAQKDARQNDEEDGGEQGESSDDDDDDRPLTAVLKKLQQQTVQSTKEASPSISASQTSTTALVTTSTSLPAIDIAKMLSTIRQQVPSQPDFWKQLFSSTQTVQAPVQPPSLPASRDPRRATKVEQRDPRLRHDRPNPKPEIAYIESKDGDVPFKLRTVFRASPDYNAIAQWLAVDSTMRNDPRLAKHLAAETSENVGPKAPITPQPAVEPLVKQVKSRDPRVARHLEQQTKTADLKRTEQAVTSPLLSNSPLLNTPPGNVLLPALPGILPHVAPVRIDPRLARRLEQQKAKEPEKAAENKETAENPEHSHDPCEKDKKEKKAKPGDKRKSRMDYASPLSSYDEGDRSSGYSAYQRRPRPVPPINTSVIPPSSTNASSTADDPTSLMPPLLPAALPINPLPTSITADELLFDDKQGTKSLKEVFKTKDPTASPFC
ncbi:zinc finger CCCH domain-containing protein 4-like [Ornithodoros turicata]|uniref:zinc finger CCCH domain-containing protein 4-like n=1 Tax=Ornithodoros turicata TaxID=34597 RepID=UPI003139E020